MESIFNTNEEKFELSPSSIQHLTEAAKWSKFLSIVGFVGVALFIVLALFMGIVLPSLNEGLGMDAFQQLGNQGNKGNMAIFGPIMAFIYLAFAILYFFPVLYLFNFSKKAQLAIKEMNNELIEASFNNLRKHFKFIGILVIVIIALYALAFVGAIMGGILASQF
ncbi:MULTISPECIES: DUF5362 family protein [unclassified Lentimicrobium]|uniref:DUF5362 family protein n=1 Tax=unclassified Lentimicrobium TaxID=2677434 RepID=UPI0015563438|nr:MULTISPECIES: DUF5362 family protein [unclassified Lentimicrobium]NPD46718.1 hypothetical protein [Lentimicrobium sp. S6]NPD85506.1 hypothetical protein [Lentimicrobium sp. L6]